MGLGISGLELVFLGLERSWKCIEGGPCQFPDFGLLSVCVPWLWCRQEWERIGHRRAHFQAGQRAKLRLKASACSFEILQHTLFTLNIYRLASSISTLCSSATLNGLCSFLSLGLCTCYSFSQGEQEAAEWTKGQGEENVVLGKFPVTSYVPDWIALYKG